MNHIDSVKQLYDATQYCYSQFDREYRSGGTLPINLIRASQPAFDISAPAISETLVSFALRANMKYRRDIGYGSSDFVSVKAGDICFTPANTAERTECLGPHSMLAISIPNATLDVIGFENSAGSAEYLESLAETTTFRDIRMYRLAQKIWLRSENKDGKLDFQIDTLVHDLIRCLFRRSANTKPLKTVKPFCTNQLHRLREYINDDIAGNVKVIELAHFMGLPYWQLADKLKATVGFSPYAYVMNCRLERACELLKRKELALADIAIACGFSSQSHMSDVFRQKLGTSPGKWRGQAK